VIDIFSRLAICAITLLCFATGSARAQKEFELVETQVQPTFEQLESDAIAFVKEHHPELVALLQSLKSMRQKEYDMAIREIVRTKKRLDALAKKEIDLHAMELDAWKLKSKIDLLMARGIAQDKSFDKNALRELLSQQLENQKKRWKREQTTLSKRQEQLSELLARTEGFENDKVEQQLSAHLKSVDAKMGKTKKSKQDAKITKEDKNKP
jgi:hypothetical protein